eukprot:50110_1
MNPLLVVFTVALLPFITFSLSVCDELDVNFVLSTESILRSLPTIKVVMRQVMEEGTSDFSDHKVMLFGSNIPSQYQHVAIPIVDLNLEILDAIHLDLTSNPTAKVAPIKATDVIQNHHESFVAGTKAHHKQQRLKQFAPSAPTEGVFTEYIIFAEANSFVVSDISHSKMHCANDLGINVVFHGQKHRRYDFGMSEERECNINLFWDGHLLDGGEKIHKKAKALLHAITCKAKVYDDNANEVLLNHQSHFVDPNSYIDCHFVYKTDRKVSNELDELESYIHVVDGANEYTKYKTGYYMIVTRDEVDDLPASCRNGGFAYKIVEILPMKDGTLRLKIKTPRSPQEYIFKSNFEKHAKIDVSQNELHRQLWWIYVNGSGDVYEHTWHVDETYGSTGVSVDYDVYFGIDINAHFFMDWDWWTENEAMEISIDGSYWY